MIAAILAAITCNLADSVDGVSVDQDPTGVGRNQGVQVLHPS